MRLNGPRRRNRGLRVPHGFALVELLAAIVVTSLLGAALFRLVDRSQRFARGIASMADQRAQLAVAAFALDSELQGAAPADGDFLSASDSAVAYLGRVGSAVACNVASSALDLAPANLASGVSITWWNTAPQPADSVLVFDQGASPGDTDDRWWHVALASVVTLASACKGSPYVDSIADAGKNGWRLTTALPLPPTVASGAPVLVVRPQRFALYRSGSEWMLGWTEWNHVSGTWHVIQPVAGPLLPYAAGAAASGFSLAWRDSLGAPIAPAPGAVVGGVSFTLRGVTREAVRMDGVVAGLRRDSLQRLVALRNRP